MNDHARHPAKLPRELLLEHCEVKRTRGSGPGGQHRNKVETAIVITHRPTGIKGQASEKRSQHRNREVAIERLRLNLATEFRTEFNGPSELWQSKTKSRKIKVSTQHQDYPAIIAEALDAVQSKDFDVASAANQLDVSTSQLVKLLQTHEPAILWVNQNRQERGQKKMR